MNLMNEKELRASQIGILDYIDAVCRENGLIYYLAGGTLLGAVRHKGYIPWDDDIDLFMKRNDYEQLIRIMSKDIDANNQYVLMSLESTPQYYYPYVKVVDNKTCIKEQYMRQVPGDGVWVDIFPLDFYDDDKKPYSKLNRLVFAHRLASQNKTIPSGNWGKDIFKSAVHLFYRFRDPAKLARKIDKIAQCTDKETDFLYVGLSPVGKKDLFNKEWFDKIVDLQFEGKKYMAPAAWSDILSHRYGDYMCLPPESERVSNHSYTAYWREVV